MDARLDFIRGEASHRTETLREIVEEGLSAPQKNLPCRYFYDTTGSLLFERICKLPEYYPTRTEQGILERYAPEIIEAAGRNLTMVEFGSGSSCKTRLLLTAALDRQAQLRYVPIDISADFLRDSALILLNEYDRLNITAVAAEYNDGIAALPSSDGPRLILFLGSNIGNFTHGEATAFLARIRRKMQPQDRLLIGVDLLKDRSIIKAAYNDSEGVTALFNKNLLSRINSELDGEFDLDTFDHYAPFVEGEARIEMRLVSRREQSVRIGALNREFKFKKGESIHTENSHKYSLESFGALSRAAGLAVQARWLDEKQWFAEILLSPVMG
jgi:L-histidine N-alpha-methyltransferase